MKKCSELYLYPAQSSKTAAQESSSEVRWRREGGWVSQVWVGVGVGSVVSVRVVGVRWWVGKVVGHEACEHELEAGEKLSTWLPTGDS